MREFDEIEIYDGKTLAFSFRKAGEDTLLQLGDDGVTFSVTVPDHDAKSNMARLDLPKELAIAATAKAVFVQAYLQGHMSRDGLATSTPAFPNISAEVRVEPFTMPNQSRRTFGVWARRQSSSQVLAA